MNIKLFWLFFKKTVVERSSNMYTFPFFLFQWNNNWVDWCSIRYLGPLKICIIRTYARVMLTDTSLTLYSISNMASAKKYVTQKTVNSWAPSHYVTLCHCFILYLLTSVPFTKKWQTSALKRRNTFSIYGCLMISNYIQEDSKKEKY